MLRKAGNVLSKTFVKTMILLGLFGIGLWFLAQLISLSGRNSLTSPLGQIASRYRTFATTGS